MGQARARAAEIARLKNRVADWQAGLDGPEARILELAKRLDERLVRGRRFTGGCYHLCFFMTKYLTDQGIQVEPVVGWVNDGRWEGITSHAWIEYKGKITDVSMTLTEHPDAQPIGAMIVHDFVVRAGEVSYSYYKNDSPAVALGRESLARQEGLAALHAHKEQEHAHMVSIAAERRFDDYLSAAPPGGRFADIVALIG